MTDALVDGLRSFNRTVTQRIGVLESEYLARDRPLGQSRVLWEIGAGGCDIRELRARLGLDSGYLSRLLRALEGAGLIEVSAADGDTRVRTARLTDAGRDELAELDRRSDDLARSILEPLTAHQRTRLADAMAEVERLFVASQVRVAVMDTRSPEARYCIRAYFEEITARFSGGFDPALTLPAGDVELSTPAGLFLVATLHEEPVGCGGLKMHGGAGVAEIKRVWISPTVRGMGLGKRILAELERQAESHGANMIRLDTNRALTEAIAMYRSAGYREISAFNDEQYAHHWFEKRLSS
ncbi:MarR family transcriptional regulator [Mycobacterium sp. CBMA271]|uniref:bifunctional helix-turn-helix transcriptional regulator/GNAT family N-acetyltransferase n=1 Tax=unclassified Mycobacteroides TaxID=2618759 RepID=UPI0012DC04D1|nr:MULTISPECIES: helix-turn-helix domain-containing GNAT family N-acetyltransferase [unclassified Mycobacteroides]MUM15610.1 MarR family transcriptional regulator [Mycobacteroides sp. CBMA 326]MUM17405.1 MarR family transcriptional regulator [Mycobacteroides sp. CBMA 326]MUM21880.1 MarR family transcriptional regulator [Mycobacteroides sp. CBMA 271]